MVIPPRVSFLVDYSKSNRRQPPQQHETSASPLMLLAAERQMPLSSAASAGRSREARQITGARGRICDELCIATFVARFQRLGLARPGYDGFRAAEGNPRRLGDLQPGLDAAEGERLSGEGIPEGRHHRPLGTDRLLEQRAAIPQRRLDRFRLDRRLRRAGCQDQRQPDQVGLCLFAPGMDRAGRRQGLQRSPRSRSSKARRWRWCAAPIRTSSWCARCSPTA